MCSEAIYDSSDALYNIVQTHYTTLFRRNICVQTQYITVFSRNICVQTLYISVQMQYMKVFRSNI